MSVNEERKAALLGSIFVEQEFRPLFKHERELIEKLLEHEFVGA